MMKKLKGKMVIGFQKFLYRKFPNKKDISQDVILFVSLHCVASCKAKIESKSGFDLCWLKNTT